MRDPEEENEATSSGHFQRGRLPQPAKIAGIPLLVALIALGSFTAVHLVTDRQQLTTPTPTLAAGSNLFYIETSPAWGSISIDGRMLSHLPDRQSDKPLMLLAGLHQVVWHADPFPLQQCVLIVPVDVMETHCLSGNTTPVPGHPGLKVFLLTFAASTLMLTEAQRASLFQAAQTTLNSVQSTETVQPGEQYVDLQASHFIATATQPLRATLRFQLDTNAGSMAPCQSEFTNLFNVCAVQGQDCHLFCGGGEGPPVLLAAKQRISWFVFAALRFTWEYSTLSGQVVARGQLDSPDNSGAEYLVTLSLAWDGSSWNVRVPSLLAGPTCAAASASIRQNMDFQSEGPNSNMLIQWEFASGSNNAVGCLAEAFPLSAFLSTPAPTFNPKPLAFCVYRFGIFLAVDNAAHRYWPSLPLADASEQSIARRLEALPVHF